MDIYFLHVTKSLKMLTVRRDMIVKRLTHQPKCKAKSVPRDRAGFMIWGLQAKGYQNYCIMYKSSNTDYHLQFPHIIMHC